MKKVSMINQIKKKLVFGGGWQVSSKFMYLELIVSKLWGFGEYLDFFKSYCKINKTARLDRT